VNGCTICGGYGMKHDPIAHGAEERERRLLYAFGFDCSACDCSWGAHTSGGACEDCDCPAFVDGGAA
jgi:hypothetical protein